MNFRQLLLSAAGTLACLTSFATTSVTDFRVQNADRPLAVEDRHPLFSWKMSSDEMGQKQTAYSLEVIRKSDGSTIWDTGKVLSDKSVGIPYRGVALQADMAYDVRLTVWDRDGRQMTEETVFETGLMNPKISAWKGAKWIGSSEKALDAASQSLFRIKTGFQIIKGGKAELVLGADDPRLGDTFLNAEGVCTENFVKVVIDLEGVGTEKGAELRIYRFGYTKEDKVNKPLYCINAKDFPESNINEIFTAENADKQHTIEIKAEASDMSFIIDGVEFISEKPRRMTGIMAYLAAMGGISRATKFTVGPVGSGGNFPTFPNLCSVGFAAAPGSEVVYTDYAILDAGQSIDNVAFDSRTGAGYGIFEDMTGVEVAGNQIIVTNKTRAMLTQYADPSFGASTMLRTSFSTQEGKMVKSARLYASAMGIYTLWMNGQRVGEDWFAPGDSQYRETVGYLKYDVTELIKPGENAVGAFLSGGWYTGYMTFTPSNYNFFGDHEALLARLIITYDDGSRQEIVTDPQTWKVFRDGPDRFNSFFQGTRYDASKEAAVKGWTESSYDDSKWGPAEVIAQRDWVDFDITARYDSPVTLRETLTAQKVERAHDAHTYIYNMGVNMVGMPEISIPAGWLQKGDVVTLAYAEQLYPGFPGDSDEYVQRFGPQGRDIAGHLLFETNRGALDLDFYTADGSGAVVIRPKGTFRGYQYIQITLPSHEGPLPLENVKGLVLSSCEVPTGQYFAETSDGRTGQLANQLFKNIQRSQLGNFLTIPTDCPQRNERMGWTGDAQAYSRTGIYNADIQNFFRQWMVALRDDQGVGNDREVPGGIGSTVPTYNKTDDPTFANGTTWSAAVCMVPWQMYIQYGDTQIIEENIEAMVDWLNGMAFYKYSEEYPHLSSKASGLADHLALDGRTPADLVNNAIYIYMMEVTAKMAEVTGHQDYAAMLRERHDLAKEEWNRAYVNPETGKTRSLQGKTVHTQASYATPLNFNVFSDANKAAAERHLANLAARPAESGPNAEEREKEKIKEETYDVYSVLSSGNTDYNFKPWTITTGFSGTPNILPALTRGGYAEEAYNMFSCTECPSWLYPVTLGATSMWERWNSLDTAFSVPNQNSMNSFNHFALGAVGQWMYEYQLGITTDHHATSEGGYQHFVLQPVAGGNFTSLSGSYASNYGTISSSWTASEGTIKTYSCTVPANTEATLYLPVSAKVKCESSEFAEFVGMTERNGMNTACYRLSSGTHRFTVGRNAVRLQ